jgi:hypothetical protein
VTDFYPFSLSSPYEAEKEANRHKVSRESFLQIFDFERMRTMNSKRKSFLYQAKRHMLVLTASLLLIPALPSGLHAEAPSATAYV